MAIDPSKIVEAIQAVQPLINLISGLFKKHPKPVVPAPVSVTASRREDDDHIPAPPAVVAASLRPERVTLRIYAQYNAGLFPDQYNADNPDGMYPDPMGMVARNEAFNRLSKIWADASGFAGGKELGGNELKAADLAYRTEHVVTKDGVVILDFKGLGQDANGGPVPGWGGDPTGDIGAGSTSWINSLGCNLQLKAWGEGTYTVTASIGGAVSNSITFRVS